MGKLLKELPSWDDNAEDFSSKMSSGSKTILSQTELIDKFMRMVRQDAEDLDIPVQALCKEASAPSALLIVNSHRFQYLQPNRRFTILQSSKWSC